MNVLTVNVIGKTNEDPPNFTISFEDDLAVLQVSESNESKRNRKPLKTLRSISKQKMFSHTFSLLCYKTNGSWFKLCFYLVLDALGNYREFKKLRRQLQGKRDIKIELCVKLSLLRLFHVYHVVQNRRSALSVAWHEWLSGKGKE